MAVFIGVIFYAYALVSYIFESISAASIYKKRQDRVYGTAWIPFYNKYLLGKAAGNSALGLISGLLNLVTVVLSIYCYRYGEMDLIAFGILLLCFSSGICLRNYHSSQII